MKRNEAKKIGNKLFCVDTQILENYNCDDSSIEASSWKFKGRRSVVVQVGVYERIYEKNAFGEGQHSYYKDLEASQATMVGIVAHYLNNGELGTGTLYTPTDWNFITLEDLESYDKHICKYEVLTLEELKIIKHCMFKYDEATLKRLPKLSRAACAEY